MLLTEGRPRNKTNRVPFFSTFNDQSPEISQIICKHWAIIKNSYGQILEFQTPPMISCKWATSLKDRLVQSEVADKPIVRQGTLGKPRLGSFPCLSCINCKLMDKGEVFIHPTTNVPD